LEQSATAAAAAALASQGVAEAAVANVEDSVDEATEKANEAAAAALEAAQSALEAAQDALAAAESAAEAAASASTIDPDNFATAAQGDNADTAFGWGNHASAGYAADSAVVKLTGNQTIAGTKTFSSTIAGTTNTQVSLTDDQTIAGVKTFSSSPVVPNASTATQALAFGQVSTANAAPVKTALNASGDAPIYACRAWVNFNGTGTVAIRASGNVSSITDNGTGDYRVNFTTAMPDVNYFVTAFPGSNNTNTVIAYESDFSVRTTSSIRCTVFAINVDVFDSNSVNVAIFR
jgi:multidrug efflux pump subunit AcrA (membrane-fusion protein)